uniref:Divergent PAP2 family protein n=1 Tax=Candidatus Giovannonibacteria bacterium GW2011_GWF2_42_19 TaxID=1618659 RepID=A0A0G0ZBE9_9BACT|nr:MAG: hypothetical protein UV11_C0036G0006 [Candidatus Giovannonibacteria bacterium GW2011_GWF2_42_19]
MNFFLIPFSVLVICQGIKLLIYISKKEGIAFNKLIWEGFWVGKFPSTHSAVISSSFYLLVQTKETAFIGFAFFVSLLIFYGLIEDKKRQELFEFYFSRSKDSSLQTLVRERKLLDFSGHAPIQVISGIVLGVGISVLIESLLK